MQTRSTAASLATPSVVAALVVLVLAGCGGSDQAAHRTTGTPRPSPTQVSAEGAAVVPLDQRVRARIRMPIDGDDLVEVGGSLWIKSEIGFVIRVDPVRNRVLGTIRLDDKGLPFKRYCQGIGTDGTSVWTCSTHLRTTTMVRLDPSSGTVAESFAVDKYYDQLRLPYVAGRIWVSTDAGRTLAGLRAGGDVVKLPLDRVCGQVTGSGDDLVVTCFPDGTVERIDAGTGKVLARAEVPQPGVVAATADDVWVGSSDGLLRLAAGSLRRTAVFTGISPLLVGDVRATDDEVWVRLKGEQFLYRIDPATNRVTEFVKGEPSLSSGSLLVTDDAMWTTAYDNQLLFRLSR